MMTCKKLTGKTPFRLVHGQVAVMLMEYIVLNLGIIAVIEMEDLDVMEEYLTATCVRGRPLFGWLSTGGAKS